MGLLSEPVDTTPQGDSTMLVINPYDTTYGKVFNISKIKNALETFYVTNYTKGLAYEYNAPGLCIITGYNKEEEHLPIFNHPILIEDYKSNHIVAVDLRKYVNKIQEQPLKVSDIFKDKASCVNLINTALIMLDLANEELGIYRPYVKTITTSYAYFVSYLVNSVVTLNPVERLQVELASLFMANILLTPNKKDKELDDYLDVISARMTNTKMSLPFTKQGVEIVIAKCNFYTPTITSLVENIKANLPHEKSSLIKEEILIGLTSNMWFGPNSNESIIMSLECMPLWISLLYSALGDNTYKRSRITTILDRYNRQIDKNDFIKQFELLLKEKMIH